MFNPVLFWPALWTLTWWAALGALVWALVSVPAWPPRRWELRGAVAAVSLGVLLLRWLF